MACSDMNVRQQLGSMVALCSIDFTYGILPIILLSRLCSLGSYSFCSQTVPASTMVLPNTSIRFSSYPMASLSDSPFSKDSKKLKMGANVSLAQAIPKQEWIRQITDAISLKCLSWIIRSTSSWGTPAWIASLPILQFRLYPSMFIYFFTMVHTLVVSILLYRFLQAYRFSLIASSFSTSTAEEYCSVNDRIFSHSWYSDSMQQKSGLEAQPRPDNSSRHWEQKAESKANFLCFRLAARDSVGILYFSGYSKVRSLMVFWEQSMGKMELKVYITFLDDSFLKGRCGYGLKFSLSLETQPSASWSLRRSTPKLVSSNQASIFLSSFLSSASTTATSIWLSTCLMERAQLGRFCSVDYVSLGRGKNILAVYISVIFYFLLKFYYYVFGWAMRRFSLILGYYQYSLRCNYNTINIHQFIICIHFICLFAPKS